MENNIINNEVKSAILKVTNYYLTLQQNNPNICFIIKITSNRLPCTVKKDGNMLFEKELEIFDNCFKTAGYFYNSPRPIYLPNDLYNELKNEMINSLPNYEL